ncbi:MAG: hypothetical protein ACM31D_01870 [Bacteroidota bacterium]
MTHNDKQPQENTRFSKPGDQAPPGTPGTGEALCPTCGGRGTLDGRPCVDCAGTGIVTQGIGGA